MSDAQLSGGATALADQPGEEDDEFALDVRVVMAHDPIMRHCPTDDNCGNTCEEDASACDSFADDPS